jgi:putative membrane protein
MGQIVLRLLSLGVAIFVVAYVLPGIYLASFGYALLVALILTLVNIFVKPILQILTLPITIFTLGLFLLVINALMILLVDYLMDGFEVSGFWVALLFSVLITILNSILEAFLGVGERES